MEDATNDLMAVFSGRPVMEQFVKNRLKAANYLDKKAPW